MKHLKTINELSGTELIGPVGPAFGYCKVKNKTLNLTDTNVVRSEINDKLYTIDDYNQLYNDYLKFGGKPFTDLFSVDSLDKVIYFLRGKVDDFNYYNI